MKKILKVIAFLVLVIVVAAGGFIGYLSMSEYKPEPVEPLEVTGYTSPNRILSPGMPLKVMTWNIGYGALGETADFFMDGGEMVKTADEDLVNKNMTAVIEELHKENADFYLIQEADRDSSRSHGIDEADMICSALGVSQSQDQSQQQDQSQSQGQGQPPWQEGGNPSMIPAGSYCSAFAYNYRAPFVPYPLPPIGKVESGILSLSSYQVSEAVRFRLPIPFSWPVRTVNLKRCLLAERIPVGNTGRSLLLVNLHLEAYDDGKGKEAQTKALKELLDGEYARGNYVIAGGDFNQTFSNVDSDAYPVQKDKWKPGAIEKKSFGKSWQFKMDADTPTCRSLDQPYVDADKENFQYYMIDGFIVSKNIKVNSIRTEDLGFVNSDHNPVVMEFILK